jgi:hypothetical protein
MLQSLVEAADHLDVADRGSLAVHTTLLITHAVPTAQPLSVAQIAQRLLPAYTVDGGRVHLAGCTLEDRLLARLSFCVEGQPLDWYVDADGQPLGAAEVEALGLTQSAPLAKPPQAGTPLLDRWLTVALPAAERRFALDNSRTLLAVTALWCKFAEGKLRFSIDHHSCDLPFAGWAQTLQPPPYLCPYAGLATMHLSKLDDGRIVANEAVGRCAETGRRVLQNELVSCGSTGRRVLAELTKVCPVTGQPVLAATMVTCDTCGQAVSPAAIERGRCRGCRNPKAIGKADPRLARILHEHSQLDRWGNWRISETPAVYVLTASAWLKRLLLVIDKESLELRRVAQSGRFAGRWEVITPSRLS